MWSVRGFLRSVHNSVLIRSRLWLRSLWRCDECRCLCCQPRNIMLDAALLLGMCEHWCYNSCPAWCWNIEWESSHITSVWGDSCSWFVASREANEATSAWVRSWWHVRRCSGWSLSCWQCVGQTLNRWQACIQVRQPSNPGHMQHWETDLAVALVPGWLMCKD